MKDDGKTRGQLIDKLNQLRKQIAELEEAGTKRKKTEEELRLQSEVISNMAEGVHLTRTTDGIIVYTNPKFEKMFGYGPGEMPGKNIAMVNAPGEKTPEEVAEKIQKVLRKYGVWEGEVYNIKKDGTPFWCHASISTFKHHDYGEVWVATHTDITKHKKAEEEKNKLLKAIEIAKEAVNITASDGKMIYTNSAMDKLFGYKRGELVGKYPPILNAGPNPEAVAKSIMDAIKKEGVWEGEIRNKRKDGTEFFSYAKASAVKDKGGKILNFVSTQHDITERKKTEERLSTIISKSPIPTVVGRADGSIIAFNEALEHLIGYKSGEIKDVRDWANKLYPDKTYRDFVWKNIKQALDGKEQGCTEFTVVCKDKTKKVLDFHTSFFSDGLVIQMVDITERKKTEEALQNSKEFAEGLVVSMKDGFSVLDKQGIHADANVAFCHMTGFGREELIGTGPPHPYWPEEEYERIKKAFQKTLRGEFEDLELIFKRKNGERFPVIVSPSCLKDKEGKIISYYATVKDITERKKAEEVLQDAYRRLKETQGELIQSSKMAAMGRLAAGVSHELNQPLTGIKGLTQAILMRLGKDAPIRKSLEKIVEQADRMDNIIKNIRFFARKSEFKMQDLDVNKPIRDSLMFLREELKIHNVRLITALSKKLPKIKGDKNQLQQVFLNLISNARDAIDSLKNPDGGKLTIKSSLSKDRDNIEIIFEDTGSGVSKESLVKIFDPFFTTKSPNGGMGLGLSIVYRIIETHKGRIEVDSLKGKGMTFKITLPIATVEDSRRERRMQPQRA